MNGTKALLAHDADSHSQHIFSPVQTQQVDEEEKVLIVFPDPGGEHRVKPRAS